jgi:hypothetical protein
MSRLCAVAALGTNRAIYALPVKRMLERPKGADGYEIAKKVNVVNSG